MNPVEVARGYIGTPYKHQGRVKGHGVDCVGLLVCVAIECGVFQKGWDVTGYSRIPDGRTLMRHLSENFERVEQGSMKPGDFVCVSFDLYPQHVGIIGDYRHGGLSIIHAHNRSGKVIETRLLFNNAMRFVAAFKFPEMA